MKRLLLIVVSFLFIGAIQSQHTTILSQYNSGGGPDVTAPEFSSATINGTALVVNWSEACTRGAGYNDTDLDLDMSTTGANIGVTYQSGDGTAQWTFTAASAAVNGETVDLDFNGDANSIEDGSGNDLAALVSSSVTNNTPSGATYAVHVEFDADTNWGDGAYTLGGNDYSVGADQEATVTGLTQSSGWSVSGTYSASIGASDQRIHLDITTKDIFQGLQGAYEATLYMTAATGDTSFFEAYSTSSNYLNFYTSGANPPAITIRHSGAGTNVIWTTTATCTLSQACQIQILWDANNSFNGSTAGVAARVCSDGTCDAESWEYENDADAVTDFSAEPAVLRFVGENGSPIGWNDTILVDNVSIWIDHTGANGPSWGF